MLTARLCPASPLQNLTAPAPLFGLSCQACPWYLSIEHHRSPVVLLFLQDKDNVSRQDLQLLGSLRGELVQDAVWLPFEGPGCRSSSQVRKVGNIVVLLCKVNPDLHLLVSMIHSPPLLSFGCQLDTQLQSCGMGLDLAAWVSSIICPSCNSPEDFWSFGPGWRTRGLPTRQKENYQ